VLVLELKNPKAYQDQIAEWGIKDDRIRRPLPRHVIVFRLFIRFTWAIPLFVISTPGLILWLPVFATTFYAVHNFKKTGPIFDTWDEIAQYKHLLMDLYPAYACGFSAL